MGAYGSGNPNGANSIKYLVFADQLRPDCCAGVGYGWTGSSSDAGYFRKSSSDTIGVGNYNRLYTTSAIVWRGGSTDIVDYWYSHAVNHEKSHAIGASQAPQGQPLINDFATLGAHCTDGNDALCYDDDTQAQNGSSYSDGRCPDGTYNTPERVPIDCGYDTYLNTESTSGYLAGYWNTGGGENPFYHFSGQ